MKAQKKPKEIDFIEYTDLQSIIDFGAEIIYTTKDGLKIETQKGLEAVPKGSIILKEAKNLQFETKNIYTIISKKDFEKEYDIL